MSKEFKIFLPFIGVVFIAFGVLLMISKAAIEVGFFLKEEETTNIGIDTTDIEGEKIDTSSYKTYTITNYDKTYTIKSLDNENTNKYKFLASSDLSVKREKFNDVFIFDDKSSFSGYFVDKSIEEYKKYLTDTYKSFEFNKINVSSSSKIENFKGLEMEYMKISALLNDGNTNHYSEYFYVMIKENENKTAIISISVQDRKLTDSFLSSFVNAIEIETNE